MSALIHNLNERLLLGPIPVEELIQAQGFARSYGDEAAFKAIAAIIRDAWGTPQDLFDELNEKHHFTVDLAAEPWNAKLPRWCGVGGICPDVFQFSLSGERWFCNPPFSQIEEWIAWLWRWYNPDLEPRASTGVLLIPGVRCEQDWWQKYVEPFRDKPDVWDAMQCEFTCKFLAGRTHYTPPPGVDESSPRFGSCVLTWKPYASIH